MASKTNIPWTDATWNIARGCTKVDEDCKFCYMYRESMSNTRYNPMQVVRTKSVFDFPLKYKQTESECWDGKPLIFTSSLTDVFHPEIDSYRNEMWDIIRKCPHLIFQILTKRPERIWENLPEYWEEICERVWMGTSCGSQSSLDDRLGWLFNSAARYGYFLGKTKLFLSLEPLHGKIELPKHIEHNIKWVIVGGESGNESGKYRYRPCELSWIEDIVASCNNYNIPVFVKQLGTNLAKSMGLKHRHGGDIEEFPEHLRIREFPTFIK